MKTKIKKIAASIAVAGMTVPALALAQFSTPAGTQLPEGTISGIITQIMRWLLMLVGILGVIGFAIAGILYLTAAGDETRIEQAKKALTMSIIGVIVALLGLVILNAVSTMLGGTSSTF